MTREIDIETLDEYVTYLNMIEGVECAYANLTRTPPTITVQYVADHTPETIDSVKLVPFVRSVEKTDGTVVLYF